jgi:hypothetical protein
MGIDGRLGPLKPRQVPAFVAEPDQLGRRLGCLGHVRQQVFF